MVDFLGFCYNQNSEILENLPFSIWRKIKTAQKSRKGTKAAGAVEKSGKLKAGARQDSKNRNEQDSKSRNGQDSKSRMPLPERRKTVKGKAGMRSIFGKCDIWKQKRITYPASRMRIYL